MKQIYHIFLALLFFMAPSFAETPPIPQKKQISQDYYQKRLAEENKEKSSLEKQLRNAERELESTKKEMVEIAASIQDNEKSLARIEEQTTRLEDERTKLEDRLQNDRLAISKLVTALERIRRVPPQALLARPDTPLKTAQSAMMLSDIIPTLNNKAQKLKEDLQRKQEITEELESHREKELTRMATLKTEQKKIQALFDKRQELFKKTRLDYKAQQIEVQKISRQSRNLKDLVEKLDEKRRQAQENAKSNAAVKKAVLTAPAISMPSFGSPRLPVSGIITTRYQDLDKFGAKSEGIRIEARSEALVVAPLSGIIRFAGPFKNYDSMVIIEHQDGYHSLIGGLSRLQAMVGQAVNAGEPLGNLKNTTHQGKPTLYYELRYRGRAVNPAKKFTDLG
ncbi:MAG: murein hydrolase activator EnvC family protein [Alphaproteobacteria bacterium]